MAETAAKQRKRAKKLTKFIAAFAQQLEIKATEANKKAAKDLAEEARNVIEDQAYHWAPLSDKYLDRKIAEGYDPRIYIRTREFIESIGWGVTPAGKIWAGVPPRKIHEESGLPLHLLAKWLEFGTSQMPPRPIWRPLLASQMQRNKRFARSYRAALEKIGNKLRDR